MNAKINLDRNNLIFMCTKGFAQENLLLSTSLPLDKWTLQDFVAVDVAQFPEIIAIPLHF